MTKDEIQGRSKNKMKRLTFVEVEWVDAYSSLDAQTLPELEKATTLLTKSCGYLVKEDKEKIVLGFMLFGININEEPLLKHYQVIPRGMVRKITKLYEPHGITIKRSGEKIPIKYTLAYGKDGEMIFVLKDKKKIFIKKRQS